MSHELIGKISGALVILSAIPYLIRVYQKMITPNLTSWGIWSFIGFSLLLTYKSSGAEANIWPAIFGFVNPVLVVVLILWRGGERKVPDLFEKLCILTGIVAMIMWWYMRADQSLAQYALYVAIVADACAAVPTIVAYYKDPTQDRPFAWSCYAVGYGLAVFAISEQTIANYILPVYMFCGAGLISFLLIPHRIRERVPLKEWI